MRIQYHQTNFKTNIKGTYIVKKYKRGNTKPSPKNEENGNRNIYVNNYFKCKWIKYSNQRCRVAEWIQKQDLLYAVYKKPTSDLKTQIGCERMGKYIPCKWEAKESWSSNPHIRQNRP